MKQALAAITLAVVSSAAFALAPFELPQMNAQIPGTVYKTADHPNSVFVLEAYFRRCPYCNYNAPNVDALAESYVTESRVQVLDVGIDRSNSDYSAWIAAHHPNHPVLKDANRLVVSQLGTSGYPSTYVVDCLGHVLAQTTGQWGAEEEAAVRGAIETGLKTSCIVE